MKIIFHKPSPMIGAVLEFLRRSTGQPSATTATRLIFDDTKWKVHFETILCRSEAKPRLLVELVRKGIPDTARGWAWCQVLRINQIPRKSLNLITSHLFILYELVTV